MSKTPQIYARNLHQLAHAVLEVLERYGEIVTGDRLVGGATDQEYCVISSPFELTVAQANEAFNFWPNIKQDPFTQFFQPLVWAFQPKMGALRDAFSGIDPAVPATFDDASTYYAIDGAVDFMGFICGPHLAHLALMANYRALASGADVSRLRLTIQGLMLPMKDIESYQLGAMLQDNPVSTAHDGYAGDHFGIATRPMLNPDRLENWHSEVAFLLEEGAVMGFHEPWVRKVLSPAWATWHHFMEGEYEVALGTAKKIAATDVALAFANHIKRIGKLA
jgi:hypothetical protein